VNFACTICGGYPCASATFCDRARESKWPTPQVTVEAIVYCVKTRSLAALCEPANLERLSRCDKAAKQQIIQRISKEHGLQQ
jgi:hypothetical protein